MCAQRESAKRVKTQFLEIMCEILNKFLKLITNLFQLWLIMGSQIANTKLVNRKNENKALANAAIKNKTTTKKKR